MVDATHTSFPANDRSYFSLIKKEIHSLAAAANIGLPRLHDLDLVVAEMVSNLHKYGADGEILAGVFHSEGKPYIELLSIDNGPGMINSVKMMRDGVSTGNTLGHGLGSMKRLSDEFDLYSQPGWGTIVLSRIYGKSEHDTKSKLNIVIRPIVVCKPGEKVSGDGFVYKKTNKYIKLMLADGLGHGPDANKAVNEAAKAFRLFPEYSPTETLRFIHQEIRRTRGAVINIVGFDFEKRVWSTAGIGNIFLRMFGPANLKNHMSYNGIVGHNIPNTMNEQQYSALDFNQLILCSDGIKTRIEQNRYPLMHKHDPAVFAAAIYKDHARRNDDMSVVVAKVI